MSSQCLTLGVCMLPRGLFRPGSDNYTLRLCRLRTLAYALRNATTGEVIHGVQANGAIQVSIALVLPNQ